MGNVSKLSPQARALNFMQATRKYHQILESRQFLEGQTLSFQLPKTRLLSNIYLMVSGTFKTTHASKTTFQKGVFDKYNLIKQTRLSINNGFNPFSISGGMLNLYNKVNLFKNLNLAPDVYGNDTLENVVSSAGTTNKVKFALELNVALNERDTVGLQNLQSESTLVTLQVDCGYLKDMMKDTDINTSDCNIMITPVIETFSIPAHPDAQPDISIIKLVNEETRQVVSAGEMIINLQTSFTYRKLYVYVASDTAKTPMDKDLITGFQLVFNQADTPINVPADFVTYENRKEYQGAVPQGCYVFDFSSQGIANLGGARDYIDTERLNEFWLKIKFGNITGNSNYVTVVSEKLARLV
jgi:hypothetical protein